MEIDSFVSLFVRVGVGTFAQRVFLVTITGIDLA